MSVRGAHLLGGLFGTLLAIAAAAPAPAAAQTSEDADGAAPVEIFDPPPPADGSAINQRGREGATVRAFRAEEPLEIDGVLDEPFYSRVPAVDQLIQGVPVEDGEPSERTEAWVGFDDENVYVSARVWDSAGPDGWIANEMRRDAAQLRSNDHFAVFFDTYYDRRNAVGLSVSPIGGFSDFQITNEGNPNMDWNPVWQSRTALFDGGWTVEMAIPFKSLRYRPGREQVWGVQFRRSVLRKNEWIFLRSLPLSVGGGGTTGTFRVSMYATLVGLEAPPPSRNLEVKPYAISGLRTDVVSTPQVRDDGYADAGLDIKYGITENLTADVTFNTDFAQVEVDEQQVNLTRFSLSFPEKREFFLESRGIFDFGTTGFGGGFGGGGAPQLFYSRQIGLQEGVAVPILAGGRVTGKVGSFDVGLLSIQTAEERPFDLGPLSREEDIQAESTNFSVVRLRRDVFARSSVGVLFENRSRSLTGTGSNQAWGVDGSFGITDDLSLTGYYAETRTEGLDGLDASWRARVAYQADLLGGTLDHLVVGNDFNPEIGFVRRKDFRQTSASAYLSPRPASISWIRQYGVEANVSYLENERTGLVESRELGATAFVDFETGDRFEAFYTDHYENLVEDARISGAEIPAGRYDFYEVGARLRLGPQRRFSANLSVSGADYFGGTVLTAEIGGGRLEVTPRISVEPSISFNWIDFPNAAEPGSYDQHVAVTRVTYTLSPRAYVSGLLQYNSRAEALGANFRFRWEWAPGSELFLVYTEDRTTDVPGRWSALANRGFVVKVTRLLRI
ncbi:MAG TPA: DUF5916 domain-containing protein [Longimicrobiales bacterium]|nr:DUF5916 domain-containing protein [Longimicrobiales bacterium]